MQLLLARPLTQVQPATLDMPHMQTLLVLLAQLLMLDMQHMQTLLALLALQLQRVTLLARPIQTAPTVGSVLLVLAACITLRMGEGFVLQMVLRRMAITVFMVAG
jgi:hypothetical protein